ncbi:hypothetical protein RHMOL_Rhmol06G0206800 [Rhododendron molle]|uniref:Uncharacterized protein n=1 Tax=Rhododendron molle TaxID=49168 RepID=A0ACC0NG38_RHOML|nr:hypothetical protein RHMOL_Rhmol06G0206800 [Rhododendron molle]
MKVFDKAIESRLDRRRTFIALGGGVIGSMCGYAAAFFLIRVNVIQIPTTVMAEAEFVSLDEKESGLRATLNLGHSFGHTSLDLVPKLACGWYARVTASGNVTSDAPDKAVMEHMARSDRNDDPRVVTASAYIRMMRMTEHSGARGQAFHFGSHGLHLQGSG